MGIFLNCLINSKDAILFDLPAAKPNKPSAFDTCAFKTLKFIQNLSGKSFDHELSSDRETKKTISVWRKEYEKNVPLLPLPADEENLRKMDKDSAQRVVESIRIMNSGDNASTAPSIDPKALIPFLPHVQILKGFLNQNEEKTAYDFLLHNICEKINEIHLKFLNTLGFHFPESFEKASMAPSSFKEKKWEAMDLKSKTRFLNFFSIRVAAEKYGLHRSLWRPASGSEFLTLELKAHGPLFVGGALGGNGRYVEEPKIKTHIKGQPIWGWKKGTKKYQSELAHTVIVIGSQNNLVFFIDVTAPSDPKVDSKQKADALKQKIYVISFDNFCSSISDLEGENTPSSEMGYAYHGNFKAPPSEE